MLWSPIRAWKRAGRDPLLPGVSPREVIYRRQNKKTRLYRRVEWQRPIFPRGYPLSIIGAERLNYRVRDGNGCFPSAIVTTPPACTSEWSFPGGDEGTRTPDICLAKAALFQLSYIPAQQGGPSWTRTRDLSLIRTAL